MFQVNHDQKFSNIQLQKVEICQVTVQSLLKLARFFNGIPFPENHNLKISISILIRLIIRPSNTVMSLLKAIAIQELKYYER